MRLTYASVCDGIGAAHVAWSPFGWRCAWTSEIAPFPAAVVEQRHGLPNLGDMTKIDTERATDEHGGIDVLVGGTPCQSFSVAGLRRGMADPRGNLALVYLGMADRLRPCWLVWENVPGVLSSNRGRDFGAFLGALAELGYGFAWRVLDAQYVRVDGHPRAVPQRRRRVFVVGYLGDWRRAAQVLIERASLCGHPPPGRAPRQDVTADVAPRLVGGGRGIAVQPAANTLTARMHKGINSTLDEGQTPIIVFDPNQITSKTNRSRPDLARTCHTLPAKENPALLAFCNTAGATNLGISFDAAPTLTARHGDPGMADGEWGVRKLMPVECERLQGFPDDYTAITYRDKPAADTPRYTALGNSMAVNVMRWIGAGIHETELRA